MIEKMKKVSIVLLNRDKEQALKALRKIGLVHLERVEGTSEKLNQFKEQSSALLISESILGEIKTKKNKKAPDVEMTEAEVVALCNEIVAKSDKKKQLLEEIAADSNELKRFENWGSVCLEDFAFLKEKGVQLKMYEIPGDKYSLIGDDIETVLVNKDKKTVRFMIINGGEGRPENLLPEAFEVPEPRMSTQQLEDEIVQDEKLVKEIDAFYVQKAECLPALRKYKNKLETYIEFENINAGMEHEAECEDTDCRYAP